MATVGGGIRDARPATINDVAAAAGVSRQTVTRALNDLPDVSPETRRRVLDAAVALRYRPNRAAQRLVRGRDVTVGFVVGDLRNPYYPELAAELTHQAAERDWSVIATDLGGRHAPERVRSVLARADVVVGHLGWAGRESITSRVPTVLLTDDAVPDAASVRFDYVRGMREAVSHLAAGGRRRVGMIDFGPAPSRRSSVLRAALRRRGLAPAAVVVAASEHDRGEAARRLLAADPRVDSVLCFNDVLAIGALKGFARSGIRVPDDVAVIGVDGLDIGALVTPELTTLAVDMRQVARHALDVAAALLRGDTGAALHRTVAHTLVVRESA